MSAVMGGGTYVDFLALAGRTRRLAREQSYYDADRDRRRAKARLRHKAGWDRGDRKAYMQTYRATRREQVNAWKRASYQRHKTAILVKQKVYRAANRERLLADRRWRYAHRTGS